MQILYDDKNKQKKKGKRNHLNKETKQTHIHTIVLEIICVKQTMESKRSAERRGEQEHWMKWPSKM